MIKVTGVNLSGIVRVQSKPVCTHAVKLFTAVKTLHFCHFISMSFLQIKRDADIIGESEFFLLIYYVSIFRIKGSDRWISCIHFRGELLVSFDVSYWLFFLSFLISKSLDNPKKYYTTHIWNHVFSNLSFSATWKLLQFKIMCSKTCKYTIC